MNPRILLFFSALTLVSGCAMDADPNAIFLQPYDFNFSESPHGWACGFSDYPATREDSVFYELRYAHIDKPGGGKAMMLSGNNHSDDLFMYMKKQVTGLSPNTLYTITFDVELASNAPKGSVGVGGSPGESVYLKVGAVSTEPGSTIEDGNYRMNIDKGNQATGGMDMIVIGDISTPEGITDYTLINRSNLYTAADNPYQARSDTNGNLWLVVGTDSGFEGTTTLYYTRIVIVISSPD